MDAKTATIEVTLPRPDLYICSRVSDYSYDTRPCDEAFQITIVAVDTRSVDDPKKIRSNKGTDGDWYMRGTNHRVDNGRIKRDMGYAQVWAVECKNIPEFVKKYGQCVVEYNTCGCYEGYWEIEIYDGYRE